MEGAHEPEPKTDEACSTPTDLVIPQLPEPENHSEAELNLTGKTNKTF